MGTRPVWRTRAIALAAAVVVNSIAWTVAWAAGVNLTVAYPGQADTEVGLLNAGFMTLLVGGLGWVARAVLDRWAKRRAAMIWLIGAFTVFALEIIPVVTIEASTGARVFLMTLHILVAVILIPVLGRKLPTQQA